MTGARTAPGTPTLTFDGLAGIGRTSVPPLYSRVSPVRIASCTLADSLA